MSLTLTSLSPFVIASTNRLYYFQRLLALTQPTPEWIPAPEKRRLASEAQNDVKVTKVVDDVYSIPQSYSTAAVDANVFQNKLSLNADNTAYIHD